MAKKRRKKRGATPGRKAGRPRGTTALKTASLDDLQKEISKRLEDLAARRDELAAEIAQIDDLIARGGVGALVRRGPGRPRRIGGPAMAAGKTRGRRGPRAKNKTNLVEALRGVLTGTTMSVTEVSQAVQTAGYKTKSDNFRTIVNQALINNPSVFKKVARGQYTAK
ncbi:MAG TPA: hypothetical protein PK400_10705 [Phycisphaerales bacterium]|nr:hypothetical protein [Phycisphaerales bacterium]HRQ75824.1 hypothetical protein [Phycisphaerales bacterium]